MSEKEKHAGGRPKKYDTPEDLQEAVDDYFANTKKLTICGLALHLGFNSRTSLLNYEGYSDEYKDIIKTAKLRVENYYEEHLIGNNAAGCIFALKNFKWSDKQEIDVKNTGDISFTIDQTKLIRTEPRKELESGD